MYLSLKNNILELPKKIWFILWERTEVTSDLAIFDYRVIVNPLSIYPFEQLYIHFMRTLKVAATTVFSRISNRAFV